MKKKVVSLIMSVALAFSSMHVMNIAAEFDGSNSYKFERI